MKTLILKRLFLYALLAFFCGQAPAQSVPALINYQGQLTDANGNALPTADYMLTFKIYDAAKDGNLIWGPQVFDGATGTTGHRGKVPVVQGYFNLMLGETDTASRSIADAFNGATRYVEVQVGGNNPVTPRQAILTAPFAFKANSAEKLVVPGGSSTTAVAVDAIGNVGVGTPAPTAQLEVVRGNRKVALNWPNTGNPWGGMIALSRPFDGSPAFFIGGAATSPSVREDMVIYAQGGGVEMRLASQDQGFGFYRVPDIDTAFGQNRPTPLVKITGSGNVGIGTANPVDSLSVVSAVTSAYRGNLSLYDNSPIAADVGGQINFGGNYTGSILTEWASIHGGKASPSDGNYGGNLQFRTRAYGGALATKMILDDQGNVGIGTASPDARLDVFATANAAVLDVVKAGGAGPIFRVFKDSPKTDDQLVLTITRDQGYMGLGVVAPQQRLDVAGTVKAAAFQGDGSGLSSISAAAIADGAISARTIQNWAVTASAIADGAVQTTKIADGQVTAQKLSPAVTNALVPVGTVVAFAGGTPPDGWWICDGRPVSRDDYRSLWLVIGPSWGAGNGNSTFNIPDLRGLFLRGVDHSQWMPDENPPRDPDRNSRTNLQGVTLGNAVGSYQADGFKSHTHSQIGGPTTQILANGSNISIPHNTESPTGATGGSESRPKNAYVNYIIKY